MSDAGAAVLAVHVDPDGGRLEVVLDGVGLVEGRTLHALVFEGAWPKLAGFLAELSAAGAVAGWELPMLTQDGVRPAVLGAMSLGARAVVVGYLATADVYDLYDELSLINNEQSNALRGALKRVARLEALSTRGAGPLLDDMTRLTNELGALQRDLAKKNAALQRLDRQKNQLLGMVAHDLRNPLGLVIQFARLVTKRAGSRLEPKELDRLDRIEKAGHYMLHLVDDLLDLSAIESGEIRLEPSTFELGELAHEAIEHLELHAGEKGTQIVVQPHEELSVTGDRRKLLQVVVNLLSNAVKYGPLGGRVDLRIERDRSAQRLRLSVSDQGPGIPLEERARLFQPFGTTSIKGTAGEMSTGLGLVIARKVVEAHAGAIGVETEVGVGSTFYVELPGTFAADLDVGAATPIH